MRFSLKPIVACLAIFTLLAAAGCGGGGEDAASINGPEDEKPQTAAGKAAAKPAPDPLHPVALIETSLGSITVRLDAEKAPLTVDNFLSYVESGHYDQTVFHQVIKDYPRVVLGGAFTSDRTERKPRPPIRNEAHNGLQNRRGTIAMARQADAIDSATCHFYLNLTDNEEVLDHKDRTLSGYGYCVFGEVTAGMEVVDEIGSVEVEDTERFERIPVQTVIIKSIRRIE